MESAPRQRNRSKLSWFEPQQLRLRGSWQFGFSSCLKWVLSCRSDCVALLLKLQKVNVLIETEVYYFIILFFWFPRTVPLFMVHTLRITERSGFFLRGRGRGCFDGGYLISPSISPGLRTGWRKKTSVRNSGIQKNKRLIKQFSYGVIKSLVEKTPLNWIAVPSKYNSLTF